MAGRDKWIIHIIKNAQHHKFLFTQDPGFTGWNDLAVVGNKTLAKNPVASFVFCRFYYREKTKANNLQEKL